MSAVLPGEEVGVGGGGGIMCSVVWRVVRSQWNPVFGDKICWYICPFLWISGMVLCSCLVKSDTILCWLICCNIIFYMVFLIVLIHFTSSGNPLPSRQVQGGPTRGHQGKPIPCGADPRTVPRLLQRVSGLYPDDDTCTSIFYEYQVTCQVTSEVWFRNWKLHIEAFVKVCEVCLLLDERQNPTLL